MSDSQTLARPLAARIAGLVDSQALPEPNVNAAVSEGVAQAAAQAMAEGHTHYTDRPGILPLRTQVVASLGEQYGVELSADEITITCGAIEGRFVAVKQLTTPGSKILCAGEGAAITVAAHLMNVTLTSNPSDEGIVLVYLTPSDDPSRRTACLSQAAQNGWWIVWDAAAGRRDDRFHPAQNPSLAAKTVTLGEIAELSGWRVGWMAGSSAANKLRAFKQSMTICTTSISQWAALGLKGNLI
ncbi:hypothetical protein HC776_02795 [bacterium]|nr:hypothetical protein [bacterium]